MAETGADLHRLVSLAVTPGGESVKAAPHVRDGFSLKDATRWVVVALAPCLIMAVYNTGLQANIAMARDIYSQSCDRGVAASCTALGRILVVSIPTPSSHTAAR